MTDCIFCKPPPGYPTFAPACTMDDLCPEHREQVEAVLAPATAPRPETTGEGDGA